MTVLVVSLCYLHLDSHPLSIGTAQATVYSFTIGHIPTPFTKVPLSYLCPVSYLCPLYMESHIHCQQDQLLINRFSFISNICDCEFPLNPTVTLITRTTDIQGPVNCPSAQLIAHLAMPHPCYLPCANYILVLQYDIFDNMVWWMLCSDVHVRLVQDDTFRILSVL